MIYFQQLAAITGGHVIQHASEMPIRQLLLDSRSLTVDPGGLFFAIQGTHHDGHQFIKEVYARGIRQFVVEKGDTAAYQLFPEANILRVASSIHALQQLAAYHRQQYDIPVLAITGSNGKTIVKEWLSQLLALKYTVVKSPKSYNSQIGVPYAVWGIRMTHQYGLFEAGISQPGEMARLTEVIRPTLGLFTNIGAAHDEGFSTRHQKTVEKALLFKYCTKIYYCLDHPLVHQVLTRLYPPPVKLITWSSYDNTADYKIQPHVGMAGKRTTVTIAYQDRQVAVTLPFQDTASMENMLHCIVFLLGEGYSLAMVQQNLTKLCGLPMRMSLKQGINQCQVIDDTYNNDLIGLQAALDFMAQQQSTAKKTVILSDLLQTGIAPEKLYPQIAKMLQIKQIDRLIGIGPGLTAHAAAFSGLDTSFYGHIDLLLKENIQQKFHQELILVKGARYFGLESVVARLQRKLHSTVLEIDLEALIHNLNFFRNQLAPNTKLMAVIKAWSYGNSYSFEIAHLLQYHGVDHLAVAYADEGIFLRSHGITCPILVMNPTQNSFDKLLAHHLTPEVYSLELLRALCDFLTTHDKSMDVHLKLETGLHRLGFEEDELSTLVQLVHTTPMLRVAGIMSHLAAAGNQEHDTYTRQQFTSFMRMATYLEQQLGVSTIKHLLNSSGILRFPMYQLDMVRLGIGLYGVSNPIQPHLKTVGTLKTIIVQIKTIPQGATVGYGRKGVSAQAMRIATLAIGYADGFSRTLGNGQGSVYLNGHFAPTIGDICMDLTMIDVTNIPASEGDEVIIFGQVLPVTTVAASIGTIPYEVLTRVSERVKRVYYTG